MPADVDILNRLTALERHIRGGLTLARLTLTGALTGVTATFTGLLTGAAAAFTSLTVAGVDFPVASTYTPTLTGVNNVAASTAYACQYIRVGAVVHVSGQLDIDPTAAAPTNTDIGISLPIASNLAGAQQLGGTSSTFQIALQTGTLRGDVTNDRATLSFVATATSSQSHFFTFTYLVV